MPTDDIFQQSESNPSPDITLRKIINLNLSRHKPYLAIYEISVTSKSGFEKVMDEFIQFVAYRGVEKMNLVLLVSERAVFLERKLPYSYLLEWIDKAHRMTFKRLEIHYAFVTAIFPFQ